MRRDWGIPEREVTPQVRCFNRRKFLRTIGGMSAILIVGCGSDSVFKPKEEEGDSPTPSTPGEPNPGPLNKASPYPGTEEHSLVGSLPLPVQRRSRPGPPFD